MESKPEALEMGPPRGSISGHGSPVRWVAGFSDVKGAVHRCTPGLGELVGNSSPVGMVVG